jgi:DNA processing protein
MTGEERAAYLTLALTPGIGWARLAALRDRFGSWSAALAAPLQALAATRPMSPAVATAVRAADPAAAPRTEARARALGATLLTPHDPAFPRLLTVIPDPPPVLFALGRVELLGRPTVAVVGTRRPTAYGREVTRRVARSAGSAGLVVASGMARGLDAVAHEAALDAGGGSIGVLGNGLGVIYPAANRALYDRMSREGLLLTEYPPGERPHAGSFPERNRLIAALARVTVVIEADHDSGALITANRALEQGRDVMAVPGQVTARTSAGTNRLIRDGAGVWLEADDLVSLYPEVPAEVRAAVRAADSPERIAHRFRSELRRAFGALDGTPRTPDQLARALGVPACEVLGLLSELEIEGAAEARGGGFVRGLG